MQAWKVLHGSFNVHCAAYQLTNQFYSKKRQLRAVEERFGEPQVQIEPKSAQDLETLRAYSAIRHEPFDTLLEAVKTSGLDKIRRAYVTLDALLLAKRELSADPGLWQVRRDLFDGLSEVGP